MEGENCLLLQLWGQMMAFNINKFYVTTGGIREGVPIPTRLEPDDRIIFDEENLPSGAGLFFDGSIGYLLGGKLPRHNQMTSLATISSFMYGADLSNTLFKFSICHKFRLFKSINPILMKKEGGIYALSTDLYSETLHGDQSFFVVYDHFSHSRSPTRLPIPPFFERSRDSRYPSMRNRKKWRPTGFAVVGDTLCVEVSTDYYFYHFDLMKWMTRPRYNNRLLHFICYNNLESHLCHGHFVEGCEDVLVSIGNSIHGKMLQAALLPPVENDNAPGAPGFLYQYFTEVNEELREISEHYGWISGGMVLNLDRHKMCAIFQCDDRCDIQKHLLYIFIFEVSKLPEIQPPCVTDTNLPLPMGSRLIQRDFISVTPLHKGFYELDGSAGDPPALYGAFIMRDRKVVSSHR